MGRTRVCRSRLACDAVKMGEGAAGFKSGREVPWDRGRLALTRLAHMKVLHT
jgi:hypothetical protein